MSVLERRVAGAGLAAGTTTPGDRRIAATEGRRECAVERPISRVALIVVPCLNEAGGIDALLWSLREATDAANLRIVVADGGSTDGSRALIARHARMSGGRVALLDNPQRLQSAGVNRAVRRHGTGCEFVIRVDAHGAVPSDFVETLLDEARATGADSVTCSMLNEGQAPFQRAVACAQSSVLGNGGAAHRLASGEGAWVDHGHHALMRVDAFGAVGGYDETFRANEDAELDLRLRGAGGRIWLTGRTAVTYHPRGTPAALFRQYWHYGRGRARTVRKHRLVPRLRQLLPLGVAPAVAALGLAGLTPWAALPALAWGLGCVAGGLVVGASLGVRAALLVSLAVAIMHLAWSLGFWRQILASSGTGAAR